MRRTVTFAALLALLVAPSPAPAVIGTIDNVPAATLLLPYFEVDPAATSARGVTTIVSVTNADKVAVLFNATIWTDAAVPVTSFNAYLTGYDTITMDLKDVLAGALPATGTVGQDPMDTISPKGEFSQDINYASCAGYLPPPAPEASVVARWRAALTGKPDPESGLCSGFDQGDGILRGYVTIDTVNSCVSPWFPSQPGYWSTVTFQNFLFGSSLLLDRGTTRIHAAPLVAIEAATSHPETGFGQYTFYARYVNGDGTDHREPLATNFGARYVASGGTGAAHSTALIVWRDTKSNASPFECASTPPWFPLSQEGLFFFDEQEQAQIISHPEVGPPFAPFAMATQKVVVDSSALPTSFARGWLYLNVNHSRGNVAVPAEDPKAAQGWVEVLHLDDDPGAYGAHGHLGFTLRATQLDSATAAKHVLSP